MPWKKIKAPSWGFFDVMATRNGFEPLTDGLEGRCSVQLSYRVKRISYYSMTGGFCKAIFPGTEAVFSSVRGLTFGNLRA